ncbi:zf-HC2 domain-containing protein [Ornithinimicrobium sediminis]|uniref:zf-HC2 domain-containing protein n=1 Tax=Ornithinimicrobium sediminis TaxID=2904603 RepID=UPI001E447AF0|nr:zf-HC2 domain-containing protein [Ornithinimicrobium sediminis]MCE0486847.1 zf-HC2 domain-containing protein [Ornithinimicrobium sediminis]
MRSSLRQMVTCMWSARRLQRYLDADPSAPLTPGEIARIEEHLAVCAKCADSAYELHALHHALAGWSQRPEPDEASLTRLRGYLDELTGSPRGPHGQETP